MSSAGQRTVRRPARAAAFLVILIGLAALLFHGAWSNPAGRSVGGLGDSQQMMWFVSWPAYAIGHHLNPLYSRWIVYPDGTNLMWNTSVILPGLLLWPVNALFGPVVTYNALMTAGIGVTGLAAYLAYHRLVFDRLAAAAGALLYAFSPFMVGQSISHPQVSIAVLPPVLLLVLAAVLGPARLRPRTAGAILGAATAAQLLTGEELLFTCAVASLVGLGWLALLRHDLVPEGMGRLLRMLPALVLVFAVLAAYPLYIQVRGPQVIHGATHSDVTPYSMDLLNPLVPTTLAAFAPRPLAEISARFAGNTVENTGYMGVLLVLVLGVVVVRWRSHLVVRWAALFLLTMLVLSLGKHLHVAGQDTGIRMPWLLFSRVPFGEHVLAVRLTVFCFLAAGLLLAFGISRRHELGRASPALVAAAVLALVSLLPTADYPSTADPAPSFFTSGARSIPEGAVVYVAPVGPDLPYTMLWQAQAGMRFKMPTGYAFIPVNGQALLFPPSVLTDQLSAVEAAAPPPALDEATRARIATELARWGASTVIVGPTTNQDAVVARVSEILRRRPAAEGGVYIWRAVTPGEVR